MAKLRILADAPTPAGRSQKRGKLFERLMADVLRRFGYRVDRIPSVNYAGMEIDIEGTHIMTGVPLYAECKCYDSEVDSPKLQEFFGKYMAFWLRNKKVHGLFLAIPGINSHAKGFYKENCATNSEITLELYEEDGVLECLFESGAVSRPDVFSAAVPHTLGTPGEWMMLYTELGIFVAQHIIPTGSAIPSRFTIFDSKADPVRDKASIEKLISLIPELASFEFVSVSEGTDIAAVQSSDLSETVVEVKGSAACFEYQFPASPEHFVGREALLAEIDRQSEAVLTRQSGLRGILLEANSGWGKSSCVLACAQRLRSAGNLAIVIDSRSASSPKFMLRVVEYAARKLADSQFLEGQEPTSITGFDGAADMLIASGRRMEALGKAVFIFLDQFENLFFLPEAFKRVHDLFLKVSNEETNIVFGFCWKTDLVGLTNDFPYRLRDSIRAACRTLSVDKFSEPETSALLDRLSVEIRARLRKDLRFFLSEFSQGYPWLLKKLCAHVQAQREAGVPQAVIANGLLNVEQLFQEDLNGLSPEEEDGLRGLAKLAPIAVSEIGDELRPNVIQCLIDRRLIVRIGAKLDIYWDIFRDYLNTGRVPAQEQYIPRLRARSVYRACKIVADAGRPLPVVEVINSARLSQQSFYNVAREMRMVGLAKVENNLLTLTLPSWTSTGFEQAFRNHLSEKLRRNRLVIRLLEALHIDEELSIADVAKILTVNCPYILASASTWEGYAENISDWLDAADLAIYDKRTKKISRSQSSTQVREWHFARPHRRSGIAVLHVHYGPVELLAMAFSRFLREPPHTKPEFTWPEMKPSTRQKALAVLEDFGYISRRPRLILFNPPLREFSAPGFDVAHELGRSSLEMVSFREFINILEQLKEKRRSLLELGFQLRERLQADWTDGTAQTTAKILLDWARHTKLAPGVFEQPLRRRKSVLDPLLQPSLL